MPDVKQTISDFYRVAQQRDFSRDFQFRVLSIQSDATDAIITEDDLVYIQGGQIPARTIASTDVSYMGLAFKVPGAAQYSGTYNATFYCDGQNAIRRLFERWSHDTFDDEDSTGNYYVPRATSTVDILQLDPQLNSIAQYQLVGVFPQSVGEVAYNIQGTGAPASFSVTLNYHYWRRVKPEKE